MGIHILHMKKHSCGALLYTIYKNQVFVVLGMEKGNWFPFKGTREHGESNNDAAIREVCEETCNVVKIKKINLDCNYSTKRKYYHIGLVEIPYTGINQFYKNRKKVLDYIREKKCDKEQFYSCIEKTYIDMFHINGILSRNFHTVTMKPIKYYYKKLMQIQNELNLNKSQSIYRSLRFNKSIKFSNTKILSV